MQRQRRSQTLVVLEGTTESRVALWAQLARTYQLIQRSVSELLMSHEVTLAQFDLLATLRFSEGVTQQELAQRLLVTKGNVCGLLDRLEKIGWVERRQDAHDARTNRLHLTGSGKRKVESIFPEHDRLIAKMMGVLGDQEARTLRKALQALAQSAQG